MNFPGASLHDLYRKEQRVQKINNEAFIENLFQSCDKRPDYLLYPIPTSAGITKNGECDHRQGKGHYLMEYTILIKTKKEI